ncbi:ribonuclease P protein subunit [Candidatus Woesearchaeota archaeon]|nr:ribonuclease P protein subunit [Candidatus Woesearchaeota archaeon]
MFRHALVGREISVVAAANSSLIGLQGIVLLDTRDMLTLQTSKGRKAIQKKDVTITLKMNNQELTIPGAELLGRVDERMKK